mgnify:CR=1 FL=1
MKSKVLIFHIVLIFSLVLLYQINLIFFYIPQLLFIYVINISLAIFIFWLIYLLRNKQRESLGFLFLTGSLIKFIVFFIVILPLFKQDGDLSKLEFLSFFIPYFTCLTIETFYLVKILKKEG